MSYETRAYDNKHGNPVVVLVATGTHDVSRLVNLLNRGNCEQLDLGSKVTRQVRRHNGGRAALQLLAAHGGPDFLHDEPGVAHRLTEAEAHAITNILAAVEHIPVDAECRADAVHLRPRRELTTEERVTVLRAVRAVTDARLVWHKAVA